MKLATALTPNEILDQFKELRLRGLNDRETKQSEQRQQLRDAVTNLREPARNAATGPASKTQPSYKIGDVKEFPYVVDRGETTAGLGHVSPTPTVANKVMEGLLEAGSKPDVASREAGARKAAAAIARDYAEKHGLIKHHGHEGPLATILHHARAQVAFASRELGEKVGLGPIQSSIMGYSLERALEREGFKVFANHAIDKSAEFFKSTAASVSAAAGLRHSAESNLNKSFNWLASHGVTSEGLKAALGKHAGKLSIVAEISKHPEVVQHAAYTIAKSDKILDGLLMLKRDDEFRKSVGTLTLAAGETVAGINKGVGSIAIVTGSMLRGDSTEDTARHAFRAALTVLGGAAGGLAGGGVASLATGTAGAMGGSWVADKVLDLYDKHLGKGPMAQEHTVGKQESIDSAKVVANRVATRMQAEGGHLIESGKIPPAVAERGREFERQYSKSPNSDKRQS